MVLLQARTTSVPAKIVSKGELLRHEKDAEKALVFIWTQLDRLFTTKRKPSQDIVQELKDGPSVIASDESSLWEFSTDCQMIVSFMDGNDHLTEQLDDEDTQKTIAKRLEGPLLMKWRKERQTQLQTHDVVPFAHFANWISRLADRYIEHNADSNTSNLSAQPDANYRSQNTGSRTSGNQSNRGNPG